MKRAYVQGVAYNPGDNKATNFEPKLSEVCFNVHKFNNRKRPDPSRVVIFPAFSEFGCETLIPIYSLPQLMQTKYRGHYSIVMGWYGREYLYRHLVDEYWELKEEYQHLREYCRAFHHRSKNLTYVEEAATSVGKISSSTEIGQVVAYPKFTQCIARKNKTECNGRISQFQETQQCQKCGAIYPAAGLFENCISAKKRARWIPMPSDDKIQAAIKTLPPNPVGVTARGRKCYGRNLTPEFYERLIWLLEDMGYNPVWLGEKVTTLPCPCKHIFDFSRHPDSRDLEQTLAYVSQMKFTIQFWTASTRLAGLVGTPYILFESPDQIWGKGQEGLRLYLTSRGDAKLVIAHFKSVCENNTKALNVVETAVRDLQNNDYSTLLGLVEDEASVRSMMYNKLDKITWF